MHCAHFADAGMPHAAHEARVFWGDLLRVNRTALLMTCSTDILGLSFVVAIAAILFKFDRLGYFKAD